MSRAVEQEARWVARSPLPTADDPDAQLAVLDALIAHLDAACVLAQQLDQQRLWFGLESDRLAAQHVRTRVTKRMKEIAR